MLNPTKFFLYVRKSTDERDRQVYSIEHQLAELRQLAARKNFYVIAELEEKETAMVPGRPVFNAMLERIRKGESNGILAWHPDRLSRNSYDSYQITSMVESKLAVLEFAAYSFDPSPQGILTLEIAFDMAKYHSASLSVNIQRAQRQRLLAGHWPYQTPVGYVFDRNSRRVLVDPERGAFIRKAFEIYATDEYSLDQLQQVMTAQGLTRRAFKGTPPGPMSRSHYHRMLHDPFYVGLMPSKGQLYGGQHKPLVSTSLFDACQNILGKKGNYRSASLKPFLYRGMFTCGECGGVITMEMHKTHVYMRCTKTRGTCSQKYLRQERVADQITRSLRRLIIPEDWIEEMTAELQHTQHDEIGRTDQGLKKIKADIGACEVKLQRLTNTYVDGTMPLESFNIVKARLLKQKLVFVERLTYMQTHRKTPLEPVISFIRGLTEARIVAQGDDELKKRDLLQKAASNLKITDGNVFWAPRGEWKHVAEIGRLARAASRAANASGDADEKRPSKCPITGAVRKSLQALCLSFKDQIAKI
jgi:site-specific DNA recombinase